MIQYFKILACFCFLFTNLTAANGWECEVTVSGPQTIKLDQEVTFSAIGTPTGGSYSWSRTPNLTPNGSTASLIGFQPTYSEYIRVVGYYTSPKGRTCSDTKWLWACVCTLEKISGPANTQTGENVMLTTHADPTGGTYTWTIESGSGTLTPGGSSAGFISDQVGTVEIKASYVPPDGGEPCTRYHTIEVEEDCTVSLNWDRLSFPQPICRPVNFTAKGQPAPGNCTWSPSSILSANSCNATFNGKNGGFDTVTVTYTSQGGAICEDSKTILSYKLVDNITPKKKCYTSGSTLTTDDFILTTSPPGYHKNALLSPSTVTTTSKLEEMSVWASLQCEQDPNKVSTLINVVNEDTQTGFGVDIEIPNLIKQPLKILGLADKFDFSMTNSYQQGTKCCAEGPKDSASGKTSLNASVDLKDITLYGVPLPKAVKKYFTFNPLQASLKGDTSLEISGEYKPCEDIEAWRGGGGIAIKCNVGTKAMVKMPYVLILGEVTGATDLSQSLTVDNNQITANGNWGGITVSGKVVIQLLNAKLKPFDISHKVLEGDSTKEFIIDLPSLNNS